MPLFASAVHLSRDLITRLSDLTATSLPEPLQKGMEKIGLSPTSLIIASASTAMVLTGALVVSRRQQTPTGEGPAPPHVQHWVPYFGSMIAFGMDPIGFLQRNQAELGDIFTFTMLGRKMTFALGSEGNNFVFNAKLSDASAEQAYNSLTKPVFGANVVYDTNHNRFMDQKKFGKTGMSAENLRAYVGMIEEETRNYLTRWNQSPGTQDLYTALSELTIMTASRCLMGPEIRSCLDEKVAKLYHDLDQGFQPINFLFEWLPLPSYWRRDKAHTKMRTLFFDIMKQRRLLLSKSGQSMEYTDILHTFMTARYRSGEQFTDEETAHMMIALLMAGQHTSSTTGTWALAYLTDHPEVWSELEAELQYALEGDIMNGTLTYDILKRCELLDSVVRETLRLRPPITSIMRKVINPIQFQGYIVPKGHFICAAPVISHLDGKAFPYPLLWKPTRWLSNTSVSDTMNEDVQDYGFGLVSSSARSNYLPFGAGRHRCIGEQFAYIQLKTIIATFIREFARLKFTGTSKFPMRDYTSMVVMPERPVSVTYTRRDTSKVIPRSDSAVDTTQL